MQTSFESSAQKKIEIGCSLARSFLDDGLVPDEVGNNVFGICSAMRTANACVAKQASEIVKEAFAFHVLALKPPKTVIHLIHLDLLQSFSGMLVHTHSDLNLTRLGG